MPAGFSSCKIFKQQLRIATFSSYHVACWSCNISTYRWLPLVKQRKHSLLLLSEKRNSAPHVKADGEAECSVGVGTWFIRYPWIQAWILHKLVQVGRLSVFSGARLHHRSVCKCMFQVRQHTGNPPAGHPSLVWGTGPQLLPTPQTQLVPKTSRSLGPPQGHWRHFPQIHQELEVARSFPG